MKFRFICSKRDTQIIFVFPTAKHQVTLSLIVSLFVMLKVISRLGCCQPDAFIIMFSTYNSISNFSYC